MAVLVLCSLSLGASVPEGIAAESVTVEPGMLDTEPAGPVESRDGSPAESGAAGAPESVTVESALEDYAELCRRNRGVDCDEEARQMIQGPAPIVFPGDPAMFPRPDLEPPPPPTPEKHPMAPRRSR